MECRLRVKRLRGDRVRSYPTPTFVQFQAQGVQPAFPGWEEVRLNAGYLWDEEARSIGAPVLSLFDGELVWIEELPEVGGHDVVEPLSRPSPDPVLPFVEFEGPDQDEERLHEE